MPIVQGYNRKINAWVKGKIKKGKNKKGKYFEVTDVKETNPQIPFRNIRISDKSKKYIRG